MDIKETVGFMGGLLTTISMVPQVWRLFKYKKAQDISMTFSVLFTVGIGFWLIYGILYSLMSVIVWNSLALVLGYGMIHAKIKWG